MSTGWKKRTVEKILKYTRNIYSNLLTSCMCIYPRVSVSVCMYNCVSCIETIVTMCVSVKRVYMSPFPSPLLVSPSLTLRITFLWVTYVLLCCPINAPFDIDRPIVQARAHEHPPLIGVIGDEFFDRSRVKKEPSTSNRTFGIRVLFRRPTERGVGGRACRTCISVARIGHKFSDVLTLPVSL